MRTTRRRGHRGTVAVVTKQVNNAPRPLATAQKARTRPDEIPDGQPAAREARRRRISATRAARFRRLRLPERGWHVLRHSFGTHAAMLGVNPWQLQTWMGHKRIDETMLSGG